MTKYNDCEHCDDTGTMYGYGGTYIPCIYCGPDDKSIPEKMLKYENAKLKNQLIFTLPASKEVCGRECPGCYAMKAQVRFPKALEYRERMLGYTKDDTFEDTIVSEVQGNKKLLKAVRVHESGEMYSQDYIDKWYRIAKRLPDIKFYAFTKRLKQFNFDALMKLDNFVVIDSLKFNGLNYDKEDKIKVLAEKYNAKICPATVKGSASTTCGVSCDYCWTKEAQNNGVLFIKH